MERKLKLVIWIKTEVQALKECESVTLSVHLIDSLAQHADELAKIVEQEEKRKLLDLFNV